MTCTAGWQNTAEVAGPRRQQDTKDWLRDELGLHFDPFEHLDAAGDPWLASYLVEGVGFQALWGDWPSFLFAPAGGGKTAFRVRLARSCRVEQDGHRVLAVLFSPPRPPGPGQAYVEERYLRCLLNAFAAALLLELTYRPDRLSRLTGPDQQGAVCFLEQQLPGSLDYYLAQLEESGSLVPLARAFDPTAIGMPGEPLPPRIRALCADIRELRGQGRTPEGVEPVLEWLMALLAGPLGFEAVYLLVDGVDAHVQEPLLVVRMLEPLLKRVRAWQQQALFLKSFLPKELFPLLEESSQSVLTAPSEVAIIEWDRKSLVKVIRERLRVASEGMFDSLMALSVPDVAPQIELRLAEAVRPVLPREMLRLVQRVFYEHARRVGPYGRLEQRDYEAAMEWYQLH